MRRLILLIPIALAALEACRPPAGAQSPAGVVGQPRAAALPTALPEPGVYVLRLAKGLPLPADLKPSDYDPRRGGYFERVLAGWLYLTSDSIYKIMICADLVDSTGRVPNTMDRGPSEGRYWATGGRVYFSEQVADGPQDSAAVRIHGDTVEFVRNVYVRDRSSVIPRSLIPLYICAPVRASSGRDTRPAPSDASR
jgi:hypothetical protein